jgi:hypothetical protein
MAFFVAVAKNDVSYASLLFQLVEFHNYYSQSEQKLTTHLADLK